MKLRHLLNLSFILLGLSLLHSAHAASVTPEQVQQAAEAHIRQQVPVCAGGQLNLEWPKPVSPALLNLPNSQSIQLTASSSLGQFPSANTIIRVTLQGNNGEQRTLSLPVHLHLSRPVYVSSAPLNAGQSLSPTNTKLEQQELSQGLAYQLPVNLDLSHYHARIQLRAGQVLDSRNIAQTPDVRLQQEVRILLKMQNGACISVAGKALENGFIGQSIHVRQLAFQKKSYLAKVQGAGQVLVEL
jgi:flagella basal body P-ring formation protein FlgA